jgi:DNA-directed RNA polymerase specialized sigma24 family protein
MSRTFEELAGEELDALYQGALFLAGGSPRGAEHLVVDAVTLAFREHSVAATSDKTERWLESRLVHCFIRRLTDGPTVLPSAATRNAVGGPAAFERLGSESLFRAARAVPPWARAVLWLVMLRRWTYEDAAAVMGLDRSTVTDLLGYRDLLMKEMLGPSRRKTGTVGQGS